MHDPPLKPVIAAFAILLSLTAPMATCAADDQPRKPAIRISKETTYFLRPVRNDGTIDYTAALNARASRGVKPANNAAVMILEVCSREELSDQLLKAYYQKMKIPMSRKTPKRMMTLSEFAKHVGGTKYTQYREQLFKEQEKSTLGPWDRKDLPKLAAWLEANQEALAVFTAAVQRTKWFVPIVEAKTDSMLLATLLPIVQSMRSVARALSARALLAIHEGRGDDAIQDLLTGHKLARHVSRGQFLIDALVGYAIEALTCMAEEEVLQSGKLNEKQLERLARALAGLPPLPSASEHINLTERCVALDAVQHLSRSGPKLLKDIDAGPPLPPKKLFRVIVDSYGQIDWNVVLAALNEEFDRMYAAMTKSTHSQRRAAGAAYNKRLLSRRAKLTPKLADEITAGGKVDRARLSQTVGIVLTSLFTPALMQAQHAQYRNVTHFQLTQLAVSLERYRKAHGRFPPKLADLQPRFFKKIPSDPYTGRPLIYKPTKTGYLLYAVGKNGRDDGGRTFDSKPPADDVVVRIKLAK